MIREGYIERSIRELRQAFARLLGKADPAEMHTLLDARLDDLYLEHLGVSRQMLASLDTVTQTNLLHDRLFVAIEVLRGEQELLAAAGRATEAAEVAERLAQLEASRQT